MNCNDTCFNKLIIVLTSSGPFAVTRSHESFVLYPPQARTQPNPMATTGGERDGPIARPTIAIVDAESIPPASHIFVSARLSTPRRPRLAFSPPATPAAAHSTDVCRPRRSPPPSFSASSSSDIARSCVSPHLTPLLLRHGTVASYALLGLFGLESLVLPVGFHSRHAFVVTPTVKGLHLLDPVHGRIFPLPIQFLVDLISLGVPLCFLGLAQSWRIHAPLPAIGRHTRPPTPVTFGKGCSDEPWHDGPAAAAQCARRSGGNSLDSGCVLEPRAWLGIGYRPVGLLLGLWLSVLVWGLVWVDVAVSASFWPPAVHASVATLSLCFSETTRASVVSPSRDFCWASRTQLTTVLDA